ncbi:DUF6151 family protein [Roseovarius sp. E0-M6]|uniref:DUF6151 family protein n=1 Tax=Roseovarius sp. E0-M6 TaxID=3127118 RepID=UPI00300FDC31
MSIVTHRCRCGTARFEINVPGRRAGSRVRCFCRDCQTAARLHEDGADMLTRAGGTDIWQTTPDRLGIVAGEDHLEVLRLSPRGTYRWHAACCGTPMANTTPRLGLPFVGIPLRQSELPEADKVLGPVTCCAFTATARPDAGAPLRDRGFNGAVARVMTRMAAAWISGRARHNPLRRADGAPIAPVRIISLEERIAARPELAD